MKLLLTILLTVSTTACSSFNLKKKWEDFKHTVKNEVSFEMPESHKVKLEQDAWVKTTTGEPEKKTAGTVVDVKEEPILVEAPGHVGVLVLPPGINPSSVGLSLRPMKSWAGEATKRYADRIVSEMLLEVQEVQVLLGSGQANEALKKAQQLRAKNPGISYLKFLEASCLLVVGQPVRAKELLRSALGDHPDDESARNLYRSLAGEKVPE